MHVAFALFADAANLSLEGKLNILGVFDALHVAGLPTVHPRATLVVRFKGDADDVGRHGVAFQWVDPRGDELWSSTGELEVGAPPPDAGELDVPLIATIDLPVAAPGPHELRVTVDDELEATVTVHVRVGAPAMAPQPAPTGLVS
jgi:hypothetical protein